MVRGYRFLLTEVFRFSEDRLIRALTQSFDVMQGQEKMVWCQSDQWDLSVYTLLYCKNGAILQSIEASEDRPAYSANFEKFKRDSKNQIAAKSTNDFSRSICRLEVGDWIKEKEKNTKNQIRRRNLVTIRFENFMLDIDDDSSTDNDLDDLCRWRQCILSLLCWVNFILMMIYKQFIWTNFGVFSKSNLLIFDQKFCLKSTHIYHFIMKK